MIEIAKLPANLYIDEEDKQRGSAAAYSEVAGQKRPADTCCPLAQKQKRWYNLSNLRV